ncbi:hypothetical protein ZEAMMB73_Zm00001d045525 [Zea mays]|uniref:Uncharacterized protein n=1 Tax=Zea mays TaxID=4577 RepID=A0A1D6NWJ2_MAIZE|nr:hypothetical protein ZEAMMB73_Zm00001d045525 [Zea mays]
MIKRRTLRTRAIKEVLFTALEMIQWMWMIEAFEVILGKHVLANHVDQMSTDEDEQSINRESIAPYTRSQIVLFWRDCKIQTG